jgi:REP element-mobilizing transposase RayT
MGWHPRLCGENLYHHIYAWGNDRNNVFTTDSHYMHYLKLLADFSKKFFVDIIAYALMEWHIHLFIFDRLNKISTFMLNLHGEYAKYFNANTGHVGHVFGERYNNKIVQPNTYGIWLSRYIHRQPVEAGLVSDPKDYPWTSYRQYIGLEKTEFIKPHIILVQFGVSPEEITKHYEEFVLGDKEDPIDWDGSKAKIIGSMNFTLSIEKRLKTNPTRFVDKKVILSAISDELGVPTECILNPKGREERKIRHKAIEIMFKKYNLKFTEIAKMLNISRFAAMKVIK